MGVGERKSQQKYNSPKAQKQGEIGDSPLRAPWGPVPAPLDASHPTPSSSRFSKDYIFSSGCLPSGLSQAPRCVSSGHLALILRTYPSRCLGVHAPGCDSLGAPHHRQTTAVFSQLCIFDA